MSSFSLQVINFTMPNTVKHYVHRVGRTARAGKVGRSVSLVGETERKMLKEIVKKAKTAVKARVLPQGNLCNAVALCSTQREKESFFYELLYGEVSICIVSVRFLQNAVYWICVNHQHKTVWCSVSCLALHSICDCVVICCRSCLRVLLLWSPSWL